MKCRMVNYGMTELNRPVRRKTRDAYNVLYHGTHKARRIVIELQGNDTVAFRELGRRDRFHLPIEAAFRYAVRLFALQSGSRKKRQLK